METIMKPEQRVEEKQLTPFKLAGWRVVLINGSLLIGLFLSLMDTSIISTALFTITTEFNSLGDVTWIVLAYTLTYLGFAVIITRAADVVGRKYAVLACFIIFIAMSLGCGFARTLDTLIACRAIQGVGGSGLYSMAMVILPELSEPKYFPLISALIGFTVAVGGVLGPILGGVITQNSTWRWIFWMNGPIAAVPFLLILFACPAQLPSHHLMKRRLVDVDFLGSFLLLAATVLFVFGLQEAGIGAYPWSSPVIICTILFGCLSALALAAWEYFIWRSGNSKIAMIAPISIVGDRVLVAGIISTLCTGFTIFVCIINIPLRFQIVSLLSPTEAGVRLLPFLGSAAVGTVVGGLASSKRNNTYVMLIAGSILLMIGDGLLSTLSTSITPDSRVYGYQVLAGLGYGISVPTATILVTILVDFKDYAVGQGLLGQARVLGGSIGVAASSAVFNQQIHDKLIGILTPSQATELQTSFGTIVKELDLNQLEAIRETFGESFNESLRICLYVAVVGFVAAIFTWQRHPPNLVERRAEFMATLESLRNDAQTGDEKAKPVV